MLAGDDNRIFMPFVEMYQTDDSVELLVEWLMIE